MFDLSPEPDHWLDEALQESNSELEEMLPDSSADPDRGEQAAKCREVMLKWDKLSDLILLGDFNMNAQSMATYFPEFYFFGNTIDLVGATTTTGVRAVVPSIYSDHSQVLVRVQ